MQNNSDIKLKTSRNLTRSLIDVGSRYFTCEFCTKQFEHEVHFLKHNCDKMKRTKEAESAIGLSALFLYDIWIKSYKIKQEISIPLFIKSRYFRSFMKFSEFIHKSRFKHPEKFINWAHKNNFPPSMWLLPDTYGAWSAYSLKNTSPLELVEDTIEVLYDIADEANEDLSEVFNIMTPSQVVHLVCYQQLSPWAILNSTKFKQFYIHQLRGGDKIRFNAFVDSDRWHSTFQKFPKEHKSIKKLMIDLGL